MVQHIGLDTQIDQMKQRLEQIAEQHEYDFLHPKVVALSQKLDMLIVRMMTR